MNKALIERGMAAVAVEAYLAASDNANININARKDLRVVQAIGDAKASAGFHHADGTLDGVPYTAALDLSVRDLSHGQIATWLEELCRAGFVAFFRNWPGNLHIHGNYAGVPQKRQLDSQNEDFFVGRDGLVGHRRIDDEWWFPSLELRKIPEGMFRKANPKSGKGIVVRSPLFTEPAPQPTSNGFYLNDEPNPRFWMPVFNGVSYVPVRAFGTALGFEVSYDPVAKNVIYDGKQIPIALKLIADVGHAPLRQLVREVGLEVKSVNGKVVRVGRA